MKNLTTTEKLASSITLEFNNEEEVSRYNLSLAAVQALVVVATEIIKRVASKCSRVNPVEQVSNALNHKDKVVRTRAENAIVVEGFRVIRSSKYKELASQKWYRRIPYMTLNATRNVSLAATDEEKEDFVIDTLSESNSAYSLL